MSPSISLAKSPDALGDDVVASVVPDVSAEETVLSSSPCSADSDPPLNTAKNETGEPGRIAAYVPEPCEELVELSAVLASV